MIKDVKGLVVTLEQWPAHLPVRVLQKGMMMGIAEVRIVAGRACLIVQERLDA